MVQLFNLTPTPSSASMFGESMAQGIGQNIGMKNQQQQQGQLAKMLFGDQAQQYSNIPMQEQFKVAEFMQNQQKFNQQNQQQQQNLIAQQNVAQQLFPENAEQFSQIPIQQQIGLSNLFGKQKNSDLKQKVINSLFPNEQNQQDVNKETDLLSDAQIASVATVDPNLAKILQQQKETFLREQRKTREEQTKQEEKKIPFDSAQRAFNNMSKLLRKGNLGLGSGATAAVLGGERAKDVGQFTSLSGALEALLVDMVSKGTLSNARFKYITETLLPKSGDREKEIEGKMLALSDILGLDPSELTGKKSTPKPGEKVSLEDIWK